MKELVNLTAIKTKGDLIMAKHEKKLTKKIEGSIIFITEVTTNTTVSLDTSKCPQDIQAKLVPFGASHKMGDAAAGLTGQEAVDAMQKVADGLMKGEWAVRGVKGESISMNALNSGIEKLPPKEAAAAKALLIKLGIMKPDAPAVAKV